MSFLRGIFLLTAYVLRGCCHVKLGSKLTPVILESVFSLMLVSFFFLRKRLEARICRKFSGLSNDQWFWGMFFQDKAKDLTSFDSGDWTFPILYMPKKVHQILKKPLLSHLLT